MNFLNESDKGLAFITASEETGFLHLYYYKISLDTTNFVQSSAGVLKSINVHKIQVTHGDWCCDADEPITVDQKNHLVYFHAYVDPTECQLYLHFKNFLVPIKIISLIVFCCIKVMWLII